MNQPSLCTSRLTLCPAGSQDLEQLHALWSQPEVRRFLFDDQDVPLELAQSVLDSCLRCVESGYGLWLVRLKEHRDLLGCVGLVPTTMAVEHEPALAGLLEPVASFGAAHWNRGYAREALSAVLTHAFATLELPKVAAVSDVPNVASERMLRALGFQVLSEAQGPRYLMRTYILERSAWSSSG
jgi:[ribosomal protein S5]-alanine N-acetyltransferase